jgi:glycosyltransferase involved in cell wall biosynthesis
MQTPSADIIVPVWNSLFETRACLASVLKYSGDARLIVVDNGSDRETERMLEEFSEPLGEHGLFMKSERNLGIVPAINLGLARSDNKFAVILRPHVQVTANWLDRLLNAAKNANIGIVSPVFMGIGAPPLPSAPFSGEVTEAFQISFSTLLLRMETVNCIGSFDEGMDGAEWCQRDFVRRAFNSGYHSCVAGGSQVFCDKEIVFGSDQRRQQHSLIGSAVYRERWGVMRHYGVYFGRDTQPADLTDLLETILRGARQGHRFTLLLHRRQDSGFRKLGWNRLHTGIETRQLSFFSPERDLRKQFASLQTSSPDIIPVCGREGVDFPGVNTAIPFGELTVAIRSIE